MRHLGPLEVQRRDVVQVDGKPRTVIDIRTIDGGTGRLLLFDDGTRRRLKSGETIPAQRD